MKYPLLILAFLLIGMFVVPSASGFTPETSECCADDSTGTGGNIPGMGWGDTTKTTKINTVQGMADTTVCYDLNGKAINSNSESIVIKNGKCQITKKK